MALIKWILYVPLVVVFVTELYYFVCDIFILPDLFVS